MTGNLLPAYLNPAHVWWLPPLALALDLLMADPVWLSHPVQGIGWLANRLEAPARRMRNKVLAGGLVMLALLMASGAAVTALIGLGYTFGAVFGFLALLYAGWSGLALGGLVREGKKVLMLIARAERNSAALPDARNAMQMLVSRDVSRMDCQNLYRSLAETMSENLNDAFVAPFFWLVLGGPVGLWLYKTTSTMDSMWGYKNERWLYLGRVAARLDDVLAYIPARLTVALLLITAWCIHLQKSRLHKEDAEKTPQAQTRSADFFSIANWPGWQIFSRQAKQMASPNAGWPMAAAAWLHNGKMGGATMYHGEVVEKPTLGPDNGTWTQSNTTALIHHVYWTGVLGGILLWSTLTWIIL